MPARIALDAYGGDDCPRVEVEGAVAAARQGVHVVLVGDRDGIERELARVADRAALPLEIHHAPDRIAMDDIPSKAVRAKTDASMPRCFELVREGKADAAMSAGNSGAMMACGLFKYRRIKGVDRPALVTSLPNKQGRMTAVVDVGANVDCKPIHLAQFAVMGAVYARFEHGKATPKVGVLSNGTEESKGTELTRAAHQLLTEHPTEDLVYAGYAEGADLFGGDLDVVVTDGFTGNVALKVAEATGRLIAGWLREAVMASSTVGKLGALLMRGAFGKLKKRLDPDTYGAAPLLGVDGVAFICHGGASPTAIANALLLATRSVDENLLPSLQGALERNRPLFDAARGWEARAREEARP